MSHRRNRSRKANRSQYSRSGQNLYPSPFDMPGSNPGGVFGRPWGRSNIPTPGYATFTRYQRNARYGKGDVTSKMIPVEKLETYEPIRAWKAVTIHGSIDPYTGKLNIQFHGTGNGGFYDVPNGVMECTRELHAVPEVDCSCGFYAMKEPQEVMGNSWICQVELYGTVICGKPDEGTEGGYRAQKQRVMSITPYGRCNLCEDAASGPQYANTVALVGNIVIPVCWECARDQTLIPWDELRNACPVEWRQPFMFRVPRPESRMQPVYLTSHNSLDLPADMRGIFNPGQQYMYHIPILRNASALVFTCIGDHNQDGFRLIMECDAYRVGEWHFQVPKDARGWNER